MNMNKNDDDIHIVSIPPIYDASSSPCDVHYYVHSDDDEWIAFTTTPTHTHTHTAPTPSNYKKNDRISSLEIIWKAEQIIHQILKVASWSSTSATPTITTAIYDNHENITTPPKNVSLLSLFSIG